MNIPTFEKSKGVLNPLRRLLQLPHDLLVARAALLLPLGRAPMQAPWFLGCCFMMKAEDSSFLVPMSFLKTKPSMFQEEC